VPWRNRASPPTRQWGCPPSTTPPPRAPARVAAAHLSSAQLPASPNRRSRSPHAIPWWQGGNRGLCRSLACAQCTAPRLPHAFGPSVPGSNPRASSSVLCSARPPSETRNRQLPSPRRPNRRQPPQAEPTTPPCPRRPLPPPTPLQEMEPMGTAGPLALARHLLDNGSGKPFFVLNRWASYSRTKNNHIQQLPPSRAGPPPRRGSACMRVSRCGRR
jgi:hypothetical protein